MCGIAGKLSPEKDAGIREKVVHAMVEALKKRGPDGSGVVSRKDITLGHTRLAIIDLSEHAAQPMKDETSRYYVVYNGEVYNYLKLREELKSAGYSFFSTSDTEVVLKAYIHWGADCFTRFQGMFALAIWDDANSELVLARDPFGKKPLYYHLTPDFTVSFASTLTALMKDPDIPRTISMEAMNCFLALGYILNPLSIIEDVKKLEPSHYLLINYNTKKVTKHRYWDYAQYFHHKVNAPEEEVCEKVRFYLRQAVQRRMVSDVPLGAFLSGGLDSSGVVKIMTEYDPDVMAFSVGFNDPEYDELSYAREIAGAISVKNHYDTRLDVETAPREMTGMFDAFDEPFADTSLVPMLLLSSFTRSRVTVALSGDGADEIFGGYITYNADRLASHYRMFPALVRRLLAALGERIPVSLDQKVGPDYKVRQFLSGAQFDEEKSHYAWRLMFSPQERVLILGDQHRDLVYDTDPFHIFQRYYREVEGLQPLDRHLYVDAKTWLTDDILVKLDRSTMFVGLEGRCPYLDRDLAEYAASVPAQFKIRNFRLKHLLKKALTGVVPAAAITRKKSGFSAPVSRWIRQLEKEAAGKDNVSLKNEYCHFVWYVYKNYVSRRSSEYGQN